ncbi:UNVERIFIED_CONTAM: hypothetical protein Slati_0176700 [Sesamum latifolium]|uniref:Uncharacterized protein n=1 Tax=Sesamum latifolium TaxID=2727402 RepID=A0AAW2YB88_9LAMI
MDELTANLARPSFARVYVELDLTASKHQAIYIEDDDFTFRQPVIYENCPPYCYACKYLGHDHQNYFSKTKHDSPRASPISKTNDEANQEMEPNMNSRDANNYKMKGKRTLENLAEEDPHINTDPLNLLSSETHYQREEPTDRLQIIEAQTFAQAQDTSQTSFPDSFNSNQEMNRVFTAIQILQQEGVQGLQKATALLQEIIKKHQQHPKLPHTHIFKKPS